MIIISIHTIIIDKSMKKLLHYIESVETYQGKDEII